MEHISQLLQYPTLISHFTGADNYSFIHLQDGRQHLLAKSLVYFEQRLPSFVRVHKSALVNPAFIESTQPPLWSKGSGQVTLKDGTALPVSRRRWSELERLLANSKLTSADLLDSTPHELLPVDPLESTPPFMMVVMDRSTGWLTQNYLEELGVGYLLHTMDKGAGLANSLLLSPFSAYPALILLDARTNRADRLLTLQAFKSHPGLRSIPIIWLAAPTDDLMQAYSLEANSVVVVYNNEASLRQALERLCRYWLRVVELPRPSDVRPIGPGTR